jgi:hypothetical protein
VQSTAKAMKWGEENFEDDCQFAFYNKKSFVMEANREMRRSLTKRLYYEWLVSAVATTDKFAFCLRIII